jgi:hypothetical protein
MTTWNTKVHTDANGDNLAVESGGQIDFKNGSRLRSGTKLAGVYAPPATWTVVQRPALTQTLAASVAGHVFSFADNAANGGNASLNLTLSPGAIYWIHGVVLQGVLTGTAGLASNAAVVGSIGTTAAAADNGTLTGTEADILTSFNATLSSSIATIDQTKTAGTLINTSGSGSVFLNFAVPDAGISGAGTATFTGSIYLITTRLD